MTTQTSSRVPLHHLLVTLRHQAVILDRDLATLCGISPSQLLEKTEQHARRFPEDFFFQLTMDEKEEIIFESPRFAVYQHTPCPPFAFSLQGAAMAASLFSTPSAISTAIACLRRIGSPPGPHVEAPLSHLQPQHAH